MQRFPDVSMLIALLHSEAVAGRASPLRAAGHQGFAIPMPRAGAQRPWPEGGGAQDRSREGAVPHRRASDRAERRSSIPFRARPTAGRRPGCFRTGKLRPNRRRRKAHTTRRKPGNSHKRCRRHAKAGFVPARMQRLRPVQDRMPVPPGCPCAFAYQPLLQCAHGRFRSGRTLGAPETADRENRVAYKSFGQCAGRNGSLQLARTKPSGSRTPGPNDANVFEPGVPLFVAFPALPSGGQQAAGAAAQNQQLGSK